MKEQHPYHLFLILLSVIYDFTFNDTYVRYGVLKRILVSLIIKRLILINFFFYEIIANQLILLYTCI